MCGIVGYIGKRLVRKDSSLIVGLAKYKSFIASDIPAVLIILENFSFKRFY